MLLLPGISIVFGECVSSLARPTCEASTEGRVRNPRDAVIDTELEERLLGTVDQVGDVLDAADADRHCGAQLLNADVAEPGAEDLSLVAQSRHLGELILERHDLFAVGEQAWGEVHSPQVDYIDPVGAQRAKIRFHCSTQLQRLLRRFQRGRCARDRFHSSFCGDEDTVTTVSEALAKQFVGEAVARELRGIEKSDPEVEC